MTPDEPKPEAPDEDDEPMTREQAWIERIRRANNLKTHRKERP